MKILLVHNQLSLRLANCPSEDQVLVFKVGTLLVSGNALRIKNRKANKLRCRATGGQLHALGKGVCRTTAGLHHGSHHWCSAASNAPVHVTRRNLQPMTSFDTRKE